MALHDLSSWTELLGYVFAIFYTQHWILNGHLPNGKENGEHMGQINREKIGLFFFFFFSTGMFSPTLTELLMIYVAMQYM